MLRLSLALGVALASGGAAEPASNDKDRALARALRSDAETAVADGRYDIADGLIRQAQRLDPREDFHFTIASIAGAKGDCAAQRRSFQEYFDQIGYDGREYVDERYAKPVKRALELMDNCQPSAVEPAEAPPPPSPPSSEPSPPAAVTDFGEDEPEHRSWPADPIGIVCMTGGLAAVGGGTAAVVLGTRRHDVASESGSEQRFVDEQRGGRITRGIGIGLLAAGGVLLVGGVVRYALVARRDRSRSTARVRPGVSGMVLRF